LGICMALMQVTHIVLHLFIFIFPKAIRGIARMLPLNVCLVSVIELTAEGGLLLMHCRCMH
jgi:TRAP-type C4-dicarboxylate transport system permease small subunit